LFFEKLKMNHTQLSSESDRIAPIGIFDSGYGGLTVFKEIAARLPGYDYIYLGDNARAPYGSRSFATIYQYTLQAVNWFFEMGCPLVILACNTASAKALRSIQQKDLPKMADPTRRILGVIRPTTEIVGKFTKTNKVGVLGTSGTVSSGSYPIEINKFWPDINVFQQSCPMWVPLIENNEHESAGANYFIQQKTQELMQQNEEIDTILLACTHYPLLKKKIAEFLPGNVTLLSQGEIVADSLIDYLKRHPEMESRISNGGSKTFYTTDNPADFDSKATIFFGENVQSQHVNLKE
jgi:glutamate racemase